MRDAVPLLYRKHLLNRILASFILICFFLSTASPSSFAADPIMQQNPPTQNQQPEIAPSANNTGPQAAIPPPQTDSPLSAASSLTTLKQEKTAAANTAKTTALTNQDKALQQALKDLDTFAAGLHNSNQIFKNTSVEIASFLNSLKQAGMGDSALGNFLTMYGHYTKETTDFMNSIMADIPAFTNNVRKLFADSAGNAKNQITAYFTTLQNQINNAPDAAALNAITINAPSVTPDYDALRAANDPTEQTRDKNGHSAKMIWNYGKGIFSIVRANKTAGILSGGYSNPNAAEAITNLKNIFEPLLLALGKTTDIDRIKTVTNLVFITSVTKVDALTEKIVFKTGGALDWAEFEVIVTRNSQGVVVRNEIANLEAVAAPYIAAAKADLLAKFPGANPNISVTNIKAALSGAGVGYTFMLTTRSGDKFIYGTGHLFPEKIGLTTLTLWNPAKASQFSAQLMDIRSAGETPAKVEAERQKRMAALQKVISDGLADIDQILKQEIEADPAGSGPLTTQLRNYIKNGFLTTETAALQSVLNPLINSYNILNELKKQKLIVGEATSVWTSNSLYEVDESQIFSQTNRILSTSNTAAWINNQVSQFLTALCEQISQTVFEANAQLNILENQTFSSIYQIRQRVPQPVQYQKMNFTNAAPLHNSFTAFFTPRYNGLLGNTKDLIKSHTAKLDQAIVYARNSFSKDANGPSFANPNILKAGTVVYQFLVDPAFKSEVRTISDTFKIESLTQNAQGYQVVLSINGVYGYPAKAIVQVNHDGSTVFDRETFAKPYYDMVMQDIQRQFPGAKVVVKDFMGGTAFFKSCQYNRGLHYCSNNGGGKESDDSKFGQWGPDSTNGGYKNFAGFYISLSVTLPNGQTKTVSYMAGNKYQPKQAWYGYAPHMLPYFLPFNPVLYVNFPPR